MPVVAIFTPSILRVSVLFIAVVIVIDSLWLLLLLQQGWALDDRRQEYVLYNICARNPYIDTRWRFVLCNNGGVCSL